MKRGFTLIEMMIVVAVLVTLMAITVRIGNIGAETEARTMTIARMQRIENALSGFHAAFGCYPPVKLHGNRSFDNQEQKINWSKEDEAWRWVREVCRSQPFGCRFPFSETMTPLVNELSESIREGIQSGDFQDKNEAFESEEMREWGTPGFKSSGDSTIESRLRNNRDKVLWSEIKLFQFGVMSFLLPRYFVMMGGTSSYYDDGGGVGYAQWTKNNERPYDPFRPEKIEWSVIHRWVKEYNKSQLGSEAALRKNEDIVKLCMIPSQAACARWLPNFEGICKCNYPVKIYPHSDEFFGVHLKSDHWRDGGVFDSMWTYGKSYIQSIRDTCFSSAGNGSYQDQYLLDEVTVQDGWGNEFYYYSRSPYQSYTLWSSGPDGKTFPPWISRDNLQSSANGTGTGEAAFAAKWTKDDIIQLSN